MKMTLIRNPHYTSSEAAMLQFFISKHHASEASVAALPPAEIELGATSPDSMVEPERICGWFDSSFDLRLGLVVHELPGASLALGFASPAQWQ